MMNKINVSRFSTISFMQVDKGKISILKLKKQLEELKEEGEALQDDLDAIGDAVRAASKISSGETPSQEETNCLSDIKDNYPSFFDSEGEEENSSSLLNRIMGLKRYLRSEVSSNKKAISKLEKQDIKDKELLIEQEKDINQNKELIEEKKSLKRKQSPTDEGQEESSKRNLSAEYIDNLPYNPFDDTGTD